MLVIDVDGVLTDGGIVYSDAGEEWKQFHVRDGSGLKIWTSWLGRKAAIVTGRTSRIVEVRAMELGLSPVIQGARDKLPAYERIVAESGLGFEQVCYVGDDLPDLPMVSRCGLFVAVADACCEVRAAADYVTQTAGGRGAVREVVELILRCQEQWAKIIERFSKG